MHFSPSTIYHVYNQGNNGQTVFNERKEYLTFLNLYKRYVSPFANTMAWCLMPNHFHFMIATDERCDVKIKQGNIFLDPATNGFRKLLSAYARIYNDHYQRTGSLFRQKTKSKCLTEIEIKPGFRYTIHDYLVNCFHYIHQNPLVAGLVTKLDDWEFSSFRDYAGLRNGALCQKELAILYCDFDSQTFVSRSTQLLDKETAEIFKLDLQKSNQTGTVRSGIQWAKSK